MKHTKLPWKLFYEGSGDYLIINNNGEEIASLSRPDAHFLHTGKGAVINEANAEFIVTACNNHYELLEILRKSKTLAEAIISKLAMENSSVNLLLAEIDQVLLKAQGGVE
jgi:hypothetical protein